MQETQLIAGDQKHRSQSGAYNPHLKWREDLGDQSLILWGPMPSPARSCQKRIGLEDIQRASIMELTASGDKTSQLLRSQKSPVLIAMV